MDYDKQNPRVISIHALREEGDFTGWVTLPASTAFLSTPSARRATRAAPREPAIQAISIHALREEGDQPLCGVGARSFDFYPRPPRGGRPFKAGQGIQSIIFLSTPSARRATIISEVYREAAAISIHALREEGDKIRKIFEPGIHISIHALREEGDQDLPLR